MANPRRIALTVALVLAVAVFAPVGPAGAALVPHVTRSIEVLAPGLTLTRISDPSGPYEIRVLTIEPSKPVSIDVAGATRAFPGVATTSAMAKANDALAAINGDFTIAPGRPLHPFAEEGSVMQTGVQKGASFAVSQDEQQAYIGAPRLSVRAHDRAAGESFRVDAWNTGAPRAGDIAGFTAAGGVVERPPADACSARLSPVGGLRWTKRRVGLARAYRVEAVRCRPEPMALARGVVLSAMESSRSASTIERLRRGQTVTIVWSMGWPGVTESIGGEPLLVSKGQVVVPDGCTSFFCGPNPRSGIGVTADGKVLFVTVDGRQPGWSVGMRIEQFAREMKDLGARDALNLDGGGGTTMWVKGEGLVNRPSDPTGERPLSNALLVLPGPEPTEPAIRGPS